MDRSAGGGLLRRIGAATCALVPLVAAGCDGEGWSGTRSAEGLALIRNQEVLTARGDVLVQHIERFERENGRWPASFDELLPGPEREELLETGVEGRDWTYRTLHDRGFVIWIGNGSGRSDGYRLSYSSDRGTWYHDF